jgi:hypothetical protein
VSGLGLSLFLSPCALEDACFAVRALGDEMMDFVEAHEACHDQVDGNDVIEQSRRD